MNILLLGAPGAGKGTQAKLLEKNLNILHIAPGDILREETKNATELGLQAKEYMENGNLVPDELVINMILKRIDKAENGVILDGFPRNISQAEALDSHFEEIGKKLDFVFRIKVSEEEIINRLSSRRVCPKCGASYNFIFNPPKQEGICDIDGEKLVHRKDDTVNTIKSRLNVYNKSTRPLVNYYKNHGILIDVHGEKDFMEIFEEIIGIIKEKSN
ncbi:MAG: adenylate kinase [Candidatus Muiribacteriota bacterium]